MISEEECFERLSATPSQSHNHTTVHTQPYSNVTERRDKYSQWIARLDTTYKLASTHSPLDKTQTTNNKNNSLQEFIIALPPEANNEILIPLFDGNSLGTPLTVTWSQNLTNMRPRVQLDSRLALTVLSKARSCTASNRQDSTSWTRPPYPRVLRVTTIQNKYTSYL